jgi:hypothetical protein
MHYEIVDQTSVVFEIGTGQTMLLPLCSIMEFAPRINRYQLNALSHFNLGCALAFGRSGVYADGLWVSTTMSPQGTVSIPARKAGVLNALALGLDPCQHPYVKKPRP